RICDPHTWRRCAPLEHGRTDGRTNGEPHVQAAYKLQLRDAHTRKPQFSADGGTTTMNVIEFLELLDEFDDGMTVGDIKRELDMVKRTATCKNCNQQLVTYGLTAKWRHADGSRGCRAASFNRMEGMWDDELDERHMATPARGPS